MAMVAMRSVPWISIGSSRSRFERAVTESESGCGSGHPCYVGRDDDNSATASPTGGERALATANVVLAGGLDVDRPR
jgi:hypothetical protein